MAANVSWVETYVRIQSDEIIVSSNVTSLFTSIPSTFAQQVLREKLQEAYAEDQSSLKTGYFMRLFEFCQKSYSVFAGETCEQVYETPMGSPVGGLEAELVLKEFGKTAFIRREPMFWRHCVDDTFAGVRRKRLQNFHSQPTSIIPDIQFTGEEEKEKQLHFLDVLVRRIPGGEKETTVYRKTTHTTQLPSDHSQTKL
ncbi:Acyl-CoA synthetase member 2 mitochondrial [Sparganum proliferum]